jgi:hypothetical protein
MKRGTGITSKQIKNAPRRAVFVWVNSHTDYARRLARKLGREDLEIISPGQLTPDRQCGRRITGVVVDHACELSKRQYEVIEQIMVPAISS